MSTDRTTPAPGDDLGLQLARENIAAGLADINDSCLLLARIAKLEAELARLYRETQEATQISASQQGKIEQW